LEGHGLDAAAASIRPGRQVAIDVATEEEEIDVVGHGGHRADRNDAGQVGVLRPAGSFNRPHSPKSMQPKGACAPRDLIDNT
jgi:hypothetical protein